MSLIIQRKTSLKDESVEVRVEPKRVAQGLIGVHRGGDDWIARRGRIELGDQAEDES